jgi:hypothetical protein
MSRRSTLALVALCALLWASYAIVGCVGDIAPLQVPLEGGAETSTGTKQLGEVCGAGGDCASGACGDGVCCDTDCKGSCESCKIGGSVGKCVPIPEGTDPDNDCPAEALPDAGPPIEPVDAGDAGDAGDAAVVDAGPAFVPPDGGFTLQDDVCKGACNGKRACQYPGKAKQCGPKFCGNTIEQGRPACDGKGHCSLAVESCDPFACPPAAIGILVSCLPASHCISESFCASAGGNVCKPKLADGTSCGNVSQCKSGHCVAGVCCNDECNVPGGTCTGAGSIGTCQCAACPGGKACKLYYRDADGDGYGDQTGTIGNGGAAPGCANAADGAPPVGFVADNTDCFDALPIGGIAASVHPGQYGYFTAPYGAANSFDYNCSGQPEKETPEFIGETCKYCGYVNSGSFLVCSHNYSGTCSATNQRAGLGCKNSSGKPPFEQFGCFTDTTKGFTSAVACGSSSTATLCGICAGASQAPAPSTYSTVQQRCH